MVITTKRKKLQKELNKNLIKYFKEVLMFINRKC